MKISDVYKRPPITDRNHVVQFGRHKGKTLAFLFDAEAEYIVWCLENEIFSLSPTLLEEFEQMNPWVIQQDPQGQIFRVWE